jgi:hypothetical protein
MKETKLKLPIYLSWSAPAHESAPLVTQLRRAHPTSGERAPAHEGAPFSIAKGYFRNLLTGGALLLRKARPCSGERTPSHEGTPFLPRGLIRKLTKPKLDTLLH